MTLALNGQTVTSAVLEYPSQGSWWADVRLPFRVSEGEGRLNDWPCVVTNVVGDGGIYRARVLGSTIATRPTLPRWYSSQVRISDVFGLQDPSILGVLPRWQVFGEPLGAELDRAVGFVGLRWQVSPDGRVRLYPSGTAGAAPSGLVKLASGSTWETFAVPSGAPLDAPPPWREATHLRYNLRAGENRVTALQRPRRPLAPWAVRMYPARVLGEQQTGEDGLRVRIGAGGLGGWDVVAPVWYGLPGVTVDPVPEDLRVIVAYLTPADPIAIPAPQATNPASRIEINSPQGNLQPVIRLGDTINLIGAVAGEVTLDAFASNSTPSNLYVADGDE